MTLRYTRRARRHIDHIHDYIAEKNPEAARRVTARLREIIELLRDFPLIGHQGILSNTRELSVPGLPYVIVHRIEGPNRNSVVILGV